MHGRRNRLWRLPLGKPQRCSIIRAECQPDNLEQPAGPAKERSQGMALLTCKVSRSGSLLQAHQSWQQSWVGSVGFRGPAVF